MRTQVSVLCSRLQSLGKNTLAKRTLVSLSLTVVCETRRVSDEREG